MNEMNENLIKNEKNFIWTRKIDNKTFFLKNQTSLLRWTYQLTIQLTVKDGETFHHDETCRSSQNLFL